MIIKFVAALFSLTVAIAFPLVAYPLALVLHRGRQILDDKLTWEGENAEVKEQVEDTLTYTATAIVALIVFVLMGLVHAWYVDGYVLYANPWLYKLIGNAPLIGFDAVGYYNAGPSLYWLLAYWIAFGVGWARNSSEEYYYED